MRKYTIKFIDLIQWIALIGVVLGKYIEILFILIAAILIINKNKKIFKDKILLLLTIVFTTSLFLITINGYSYNKFIQQFLPMSICLLCYSQFFLYIKQDLLSFFNKYINLMYLLCLLGLLQFLICLVAQIDIFPFTLDGYIQNAPSGRIMRIHSILAEAGNFGSCLVPVIAYILFDKNYFKENKNKSYIIIITYLLTLATISYVMLGILLFVKIYTKLKYTKYVLVGLIILLIPYSLSTMSSRLDGAEVTNKDFFLTIQKKITQTILIYDVSSPTDFEMLNASSYALLTNFWVAKEAPSRLIGTGLGTHEENYIREYPPNDFFQYGLNSQDAYSLFIRLFSEFGVIGIIIYFIFIKKNFNSGNIINKCVLFLLIALLIRGGNYFLYGTIMFHFIYCYTSRKIINDK